MGEKKSCFGKFMEVSISKCDKECNKNEQLKCYEEWNRRNKRKQKLAEEAAKPWSKRKPLKEVFPELCEVCEKEVSET